MSNKEQSPFSEFLKIPLSRRRFLIGLTAGVVITYGVTTHQQEIIAIYNAARREFLPPSYEEIINQEIERIGVKYSPAERELWQGYRLPLLDNEADVSERINIATQRVHEVRERMLHSENPYFRHAASFINEQEQRGLLHIKVDDELTAIGRSVPMATSPLKTPNGRLVWSIAVSAKDMIKTSDEIFTALYFTHEVRHIEEFLSIPAYNESIIPVDERIANFEKDLQDTNFFLHKEAQGYAMNALAYIYERGLWYEAASGTVIEQLAAKYITSGRTEHNEEWKSYLSTLLGIRTYAFRV